MKVTNKMKFAGVVLSSLLATQAFANHHEHAAHDGKTRAQVKAELAEAIKNGDMIADSESGMTFREMFPSQYPARAEAPGKTRAQVKAELAEAIKNGEMIADGETGMTYREMFPGRYN